MKWGDRLLNLYIPAFIKKYNECETRDKEKLLSEKFLNAVSVEMQKDKYDNMVENNPEIARLTEMLNLRFENERKG